MILNINPKEKKKQISKSLYNKFTPKRFADLLANSTPKKPNECNTAHVTTVPSDTPFKIGR